MKEFADSSGFFLTAYKPVGAGGKQTETMKNHGVKDLFSNRIISQITVESGATPAQVLFAWQLQRGISAIPKSVNAERQAENFKAIDLFLNDDQMEKINDLNKNIRFVDGTFFTFNESPYTLRDIWGE